MSGWRYDDVERMLEAFSGTGDADDSRGRKRHRIVAAATDLFISQGYRKTSVDEIARRSGVAKGTVYLYFKTKNEILLGAIIEEKRRYLGVLKPILAPSVPPARRLQRWLRTAFVLGTEMPLISRLLSGDREIMLALDEMPEEMRQQQQLFTTGFLSDMIENAAGPGVYGDGQIEERARVLWGLTFFTGLIADGRVRGGLSVERFAELLSEIVTTGLIESRPAPGPSKRAGGKP
jgi:AcrR family transcriptional regulator